MRRVLLILLAVAMVASPALGAQSSPAPIKYGKWGLLAGSVFLSLAANRNHNRADSVFNLLEERCVTDPSLCDVNDDGSYIDGVSEALYRETLKLDNRARGQLFGGEAALLGAAVLFVWEFARPKAPPENIPFEPRVSFRAHSTEIGLRVAW